EVGIVEEGYEIFYKTIYKTHQLVADKNYDGRVLLIGDAAHVNIEFGGMGMNSGIHDAYLLVDRFERVLDGGNPEVLFREFADKRMQINKETVQRDTIRLTKLFENFEEHERLLKELSSDPVKAKDHLLKIKMIKGFRMMDEELKMQSN